jgi:benzoyl-CoA reductase/2-hydroxyglutaryl-CoA dehydratase subunit BcrC/BadD/HgdB
VTTKDGKVDYTEMWERLGLDLDLHQQLMDALGQLYPAFYLRQDNRPAGMAYFDEWVGDVHGFRPKELLEHKDRGGKVVGCYCVFVPLELIRAADAIPLVLCGGADFSVSYAETLLPANICPLIKSSVGFKLGRLCPYIQSTDFLVGETTCDAKKKAWEIFGEIHPFYVMDLPQKKSPKGRELWKEEIRIFWRHLEEVSGNTITPAKLRESIHLMNEKRRILQRLHATRKASPSPISGKDALLVNQLALFDDIRRFNGAATRLAEELEQRVERGVGVSPANAPRILIAGSPMVIPNWKLHHLIESSGAVVVIEEACVGTRFYETLVAEDGETPEALVDALADRYLQINCACFTPNNERVDDILRLSREYRVDGVVLYSLMFCQPFAVEHRKIEKALRAEGIPVLQVETDYSQGDALQLLTRIEAFLEEIEGVAASQGAAGGAA